MCLRWYHYVQSIDAGLLRYMPMEMLKQSGERGEQEIGWTITYRLKAVEIDYNCEG